MKSLEGKIAIITGGASGIGRETTLTFLKEGATVIIWDINKANAEETQKLAGELKSAAEFMHVDTRYYKEVENAANIVFDKYGKIDILINNAGITADATLKKMEPEQWQRVIDVNLTGVFNCGKAVSLKMIERNSGKIINTSSVVAHNGNFGQSNYVATKSGVIGLTKVWCRELGKYGINVNAVAPGFIETEMILSVPEKVLEGLRGKTPLGRLGKPQDIADAYVFLSSDKSNYITGAVLNVDGGMVF